MKKRLTDRAIRGLRTEKQQQDFWDTPGIQGCSFGVRVTKAGRKTFCMIYRTPNGRLKRKTFQPDYPDLKLADAKKEARKALGILADGKTPPTLMEGPTFGELAEAFLDDYVDSEGLKESTISEYERILDNELLPVWDNLPLSRITRPVVKELLNTKKNSPVMANRILALISVIFNFALDSDEDYAWGVEVNPCARMKKRDGETPRTRVLTDDEIKKLWRTLDKWEKKNKKHTVPTAAIYRLCLLLAQRSGEIKSMRWDEIEGDIWTVPGKKTKNGETHRVPLPDAAISILKKVKQFTNGSEWVFPSRTGGHIQWMGKNNKRMQQRVGFHFRTHDLRRSAATKMSEIGVDDTIIGRVLNHSWVRKNVTASVYNQDDRMPEKRQALERWCSRLQQIINGEPAKVVRMGR